MPQGEPSSRTDGVPAQVRSLLEAQDDAAREGAWGEFVRRYSRLLLHAAHRRAPGYDAAMDRYAWVLEKLREDDCRRLRRFQANGKAGFDTWLVVVARRLCVDHLRVRYGRMRAGGDADDPEHARNMEVRRRLTDLLSDELELDGIPDRGDGGPDMELRRRERNGALAQATEGLSPRDRLLLQFRFNEELTAREIAGLMGFPTPFHVYRRINRILEGLRSELEARGVDGADP